MSNIFALCGKTCAGKTFAAKEIAERYNVIRFSLDRVMKKLLNEYTNGEEEFEKKIELCKEVIYDICDDILENAEASIILDFGFWKKKEREHLRERYKKHNVIVFYFNTTDNERWNRMESRKNENDNESYILDKATMDVQSKLFEEFDNGEEYIISDDIEKIMIEKNVKRKSIERLL